MDGQGTTMISPGSDVIGRAGDGDRRMRGCHRVVAGFMPRLLTVVTAIALLSGPIALPAIARGHDVDVEVVGGRLVSQGTDTFMALVLIDEGGGTILCGGSLIAPGFVLTAAHCVEDDNGRLFDPRRFHLIIGRADLTGNIPAGNKRGVSAIFQHPDWDPVTTDNDVAVLKLDLPVPATIARPLRLTDDGQFDGAGEAVTVAGWGATSEGSNISLRLRAANLKVTSDAACASAYDGHFDPAVEICAAARGKDSCSGDSGGPLFASVPTRTKSHSGGDQARTASRNGHKGHDAKRHHSHGAKSSSGRPIAIGIVSFGRGCARPDFPGVYTQLSAPTIHDFIEGVIGG
jgi:secreted trypsin-like serine protease